MRLYTFCNCYLSSIQQGIQSAHILGELINSVFETGITTNSTPLKQEITLKEKELMIVNWCEMHKTIIVCNGGNAQGIRELTKFFDSKENPFPFATFNEDGDSLDGALTGVGIILPEEIYDAKFYKGVESIEDSENTLTQDFNAYTYENIVEYREGTYLYDLIKRVKSYRLAI